MMDIPFDSPIAVNTRTNQMQDKLEQQQTKMLVLNHQMRQEDNEKKSSSPVLHLTPFLVLRYAWGFH
jgi:regulator of nonsense transcripts 2